MTYNIDWKAIVPTGTTNDGLAIFDSHQLCRVAESNEPEALRLYMRFSADYATWTGFRYKIHETATGEVRHAPELTKKDGFVHGVEWICSVLNTDTKTYDPVRHSLFVSNQYSASPPPNDAASERFGLLELKERDPNCTCPVGWFPASKLVEYSWLPHDANFNHHETCKKSNSEAKETPVVDISSRRNRNTQTQEDSSNKVVSDSVSSPVNELRVTSMRFCAKRTTRKFENNTLELIAEIHPEDDLEVVASKLKKKTEELLDKMR